MDKKDLSQANLELVDQGLGDVLKENKLEALIDTKHTQVLSNGSYDKNLDTLSLFLKKTANKSTAENILSDIPIRESTNLSMSKNQSVSLEKKEKEHDVEF